MKWNEMESDHRIQHGMAWHLMASNNVDIGWICSK